MSTSLTLYFFSRISYSQARFAPSNYNDYAILDIYNSRMEPDPSLPPVQFTKKGGYFYMGLRKCEIVESDDGPVVKTVRILIARFDVIHL